MNMEIRKYNQQTDEQSLLQMIKDEDGWDYAGKNMIGKYKKSLELSITYVAVEKGIVCGYVRSLDDFGIDIYVCDLLVRPDSRGKATGRKLMELLKADYPNRDVYVMSDVDGYYTKLGYKKAGSVFMVE
jgi:ribosomal protein S18 acetylase RimI-like enzyme